MIGDRSKVHPIVSAASLIKSHEHGGNIPRPGAPFRASYKTGRAPEKIQPVGLIGIARSLIGYQGKKVLGIPVGKDRSLQTGSRQKDGTRTSPQMQKKTLEYLILDRHVRNDEGVVRQQGHGCIGQLPVEGMPQVELAPAAGMIETFQDFRVVDDETPLDKRRAGRQ